MKKLLLCVVLIVLGLGCQKSEILQEYQSIQKVWYLESTESMPIVQTEVKFVNFDVCKITKKKVESSNFGCSAPINQIEVANGISFTFSISQNKIMRISGILDLTGQKTDFLGIIEKSEIAKKLGQELIGDWSYEITSNKMILSKNNNKMIFRE
jgi:hypothetical protein